MRVVTGNVNIETVARNASYLSSPFPNVQAPVDQKVDMTIHRINLYRVDSAIAFPCTYPLNSDLSDV